VPKLTQIPLDGIVAVSLVILVGWAGQISLGQFGLVGISAGVIGGLVANHNIDFFAAIMLAALLGAATSLLIGLPALRTQGLYLAVATLAFAAAVEGYILRPDFLGKHFLPEDGNRVTPPVLWERIDINTNHRFYFVSVIFLGLSMLAARSFRKNRSGRVLIAVRDNQRAAPAYAINLARNKLAAFAISGSLAAIAGALIAYQLGSIDFGSYGMVASVKIFIYTVVGGLTSIGGAVAGAAIFGLLNLFGDDLLSGLSFLSTGVGVLVVLLFLPGGLAELFFRWRDTFLRWVADRHDLLVPSLVADKLLLDDKKAEDSVIEAAEHHVEEVDSFDVVDGPEILCPVCAEVIPVERAPAHEHFRVSSLDVPEASDPDDDSAAASNGGGRSRLARARGGRR
jgi:branched-chain amino acid transport system permease protein